MRAGRGFFAYWVEHATAANLLLAMMLLAGFWATTQLRAQFFPDVVIERISVTVLWSGAGAEDVDRAIVGRLEPVLRAVDGVDEVSATSRTGSASLSLGFVPGWDMERALDEVETALDGVLDLPDASEDPTVRRIAFRDRVTNVVIAGDKPLALLKQYADELQLRLFKRGVTKTTLQGAAAPRILVETSLDALERHRLTLAEIADAIAAETGDAPIGEIGDGAARLRATPRAAGAGEEVSAEAIAAIVVRASADGNLLVRDVASVVEEGPDREEAFFVGGEPALRLRVDRDAAGDAIAIQAIVEEETALLAETLPESVDARLAQTRAQAISDRLSILYENGLLGLAIVLVLLFLFLSWRTAFWVALGIPAAMAATLALLWLFGMSINMITLFGLIICLGIVVDDAIVVGEHADHLHRGGQSASDAATNAAARMAAPVISASITTIIAFGALALLGGRFGSLIFVLPVTVCAVVAASLAECFFVLPAHMRHALEASERKKGRALLDLPSLYVNKGFDWVKVRLFTPFLRFCLWARYPVIAAAVLLLVHSIMALVDGTVRWRFFDAPERGVINANIAMTPSATRGDTRAMLDEMTRALDQVAARYEEEHGRAPVDFALAKLGGGAGRALASAADKTPDQLGAVQIELIDPDLRPYSAFDFIRAWREAIEPHPLLETLAMRGERSGPPGDALHVRLEGPDSDRLEAAARFLQSELGLVPGVSALEDDLAYGAPEYRLTLTAKGEALGLTTSEVARRLRAQIDGDEAASLTRDGEEIEVEVRLEDRETGPGFLARASLPLADGGRVRVLDVVDVEERRSLTSLRREDGALVANVTGDLADDDALAAAANDVMMTRILPEMQGRFDVDWSLQGRAAQERQFLDEARLAALLCLAGIYLTLAWIFASWTRPFVVLLVIPFGVVAVIWGHWLHDVSLSIFSVVGLIGMAGIIVNDSIVLVTTISERELQEDARGAILRGAADRLRAVFLTSLTTVGGLAPLLFEQSRQALFLKPTVITLAYGLGFGMFLVLALTPAMLMVRTDIERALKSAKRATALALGQRRMKRLAPPDLLLTHQPQSPKGWGADAAKPPTGPA